jgi:hypothetical protein
VNSLEKIRLTEDGIIVLRYGKSYHIEREWLQFFQQKN